MNGPNGVLLTGGVGRRLGHDKALLVLDGETLAARAARVLTSVCHSVIEVGSGSTGLPATREVPAGAGPLAGLVAGADVLDVDVGVLVLAVDLPRVEVPLLRLIAERSGDGVVVPVVAGERQWVCARYEPSAVAAARDLLDGGERALRALAQVVPVTEIYDDEWRAIAPADSFADVDTEADARRLGIHLPAP